ELAESLSWLALAARFGPTPALKAIQVCDRSVQRAQGDSKVRAYACDARCGLEAMRGWFDEARKTVQEARSLYEDLGLKVMGANLVQNSGYVEMLADDPVAAEREYRCGYDHLAAMGEKGFLSTVAAELADALYVQGRLDEAEHFTNISNEAAAHDDVMSQSTLRSVRAKILAKRAQFDEAVSLAKEAVRLADNVGQLDDQARFLLNLGQVLDMASLLEEAISVLAEAVSLFERKGNVVSAAKANNLIRRVRETSASG
ncbi:MAG: tetratricopeptide repeat protein, partial [Actinobacteria bacterium]|nr:tetratricopeptide repeat protein [Acidobacteriota bacterium]MCA1707847.1 tetratricopeptide repeat protein [Actinomycetota bacterium]